MRLRPDKPLSLVLAAGGVRGFAHVGVMEALVRQGFQITEIVGASAGAIIASLYAAAGLTLSELRTFGLNMTSRNLLAWAVFRNLPRQTPQAIRHRFFIRAGIIPRHVRMLDEASGRVLHHGVQRLGIVCYDLNRHEEVFFHYPASDLPIGEAARASAAIPGFFPARRCEFERRELRLVDGGVINGAPVEKLFESPFSPQQVLVVDISKNQKDREKNLSKANSLRSRHPEIRIEVVMPDTLGRGTVIYRQRDLQRLIDAGTECAVCAPL